MKMKRVLIEFNPIDSHMSGNLKSPNLDDKRLRLERRWRRREIRVDSLKHGHVASAAKTTMKVCGNADVLIDKKDCTLNDEANEDRKPFLAAHAIDCDEMDEDYGSFLATYNSDIETDCARYRIGGSNIDSDETDVDYISFLATCDPDVENDSVGSHDHGSNIDVSDYSSDGVDVDEDDRLLRKRSSVGRKSLVFDQELDTPEVHESDADYQTFLATYDPDAENESAGNHSRGSNIDVSYYNSEGVDVDEDDRLRRKSSSVGRNLLVSNQELDTHEVHEMQCDDDEDYVRFLNSGRIVDGDLVYDCDMNTNNTSKVEDVSNSSDSDLIVLESYPNCENTPFVSSKAYDSSYFGEEMHPKGNMQMTSFYHSQFRKRLVECLDRPYDYEEYKSLLFKANERKQNERHFETRQGVIKSYHSKGVTKSYLDLYPDVGKAIIMESKENRRVLFLLRGFFFWIENAAHEGNFRPWRDESCLEMMRKM